MVLCCVDDVLAISATPMKTIEGIKAVFKFKGDKAKVPDMYLGASIQKVETPDGTECWMMSAKKYVKASVENVKLKLAKSNCRLPSRCNTPTEITYHPSYLRVDMFLEVSLILSQLALPRVGHL